jgi:hypothetical protein
MAQVLEFPAERAANDIPARVLELSFASLCALIGNLPAPDADGLLRVSVVELAAALRMPPDLWPDRGLRRE